MSEAYDIMEWLRDSAPPGPLGRRMAEAADEIANLREEIEALTLDRDFWHRTADERAGEIYSPHLLNNPLITPYRPEDE
jgi:hypothetical protein